MEFKKKTAGLMKLVNDKHDVLVKVRNALLIYLGFIVLFRLILWSGSTYMGEEAYPVFTLYTSFFLIAIGGLVLAVYLQAGEVKLISFKKNKNLNEQKKKLKSERKVLDEEKKALKKQMEEIRMAQNNPEVVKKEVKKGKYVARKFSKLPKSKHQRIEMYRSIAGQIQKDKASFTISSMMEALVQNFPSEIDEDRKGYLKEVEGWVSEDPYTPLLRTENGVKLYRLITKK